MAKNLQAKLAPSDSIRIFDINQSSVRRLAEDMKTSQTGGAVVITAETAKDAAQDSVRTANPFRSCPVSGPYECFISIRATSWDRLAGSLVVIFSHKATPSNTMQYYSCHIKKHLLVCL